MSGRSAAIPWRIGADRRAEVLLITSTNSGDWIVPKGVVEPHLTPASSAAEEAWEEAGAIGEVDPRPLGVWWRTKWGRRQAVQVFAMRVDEEADEYPEAGLRGRRWAPLREAASAVRDGDLAALIHALGDRLGVE